jgi:hypothetical protein
LLPIWAEAAQEALAPPVVESTPTESRPLIARLSETLVVVIFWFVLVKITVVVKLAVPPPGLTVPAYCVATPT